MAAYANSVLPLPLDYVALDIETTGFSPSTEAITELGAVKIRNGKIQDRFSRLVNPGRHIPSRITSLTGITDDMVAAEPALNETLPDFLDWLEDDPIIGHNVRFDLSFLAAASDRFGLPHSLQRVTYDTMAIDKRLFPSERHRLADLIVRYGIADTEEHRALSDATQTYQCLEWQRRYIAANAGVSSHSSTRFRF